MLDARSRDSGVGRWMPARDLSEFDVPLPPNIALVRTLLAKGVAVDVRNSETFALGLTRDNRKGLSRHH
jgi:hypothetical protein